MQKRYTTPLSLVLGVLLIFGGLLPVYASTTGNLKGKVTDVSSGEALPGVNILIVGSGRGGVTNEKGEYLIVGVTPGVFSLRVSLLGYQTIEVKRVEVEVDKTGVYDFKLASEDIEIEGVTVIGEPPLVDVTKTAGDQTFNRDKIEQLPNVKGVSDVLGLQAGVVKFGGQLFVRGGRANETQILVDGVPVNDVGGTSGTAGTSTANEQLAQLYSGNATGALAVSANAIQAVTISSGGLDAEFGNAQSGVVNVTTKSGGDNYNGSFLYRTDGITANGFDERYYAGNVGGPEPITAYLLPSMGITIPGKMRFFVSGSFNQSNGPYRFNSSQFYNPVRRKVKSSWLDALGFTYSDKQNNDFSFNTKLSYQAGENDQFAYSYRANATSSHPLSTAYGWLNLHDSSASNIGLTTQNVGQWTHFFGTNSQLKGYISRLEIDRTQSIGGLTPDQYSTVTNTAFRDPNEDGFNDLGSSQAWSTSNNVIWNAKFDYSGQVHELHYIKTGIEYYYEHRRTTDIAFPLALNRDTINRRGEFPGYGFARWVSDNTPNRGAMWVQDNIAFTGLNINIGMRYDWFYLGKQVSDPNFIRRWELATGLTAKDLEGMDLSAGWPSKDSFFSQFFDGYFSPRLAIGYPISTRTVFYFNYGHFLQWPERDDLYHDPVITTLSGNYVGNPGLKPQRTVQYEAGFDQLVYDDLSVGIRGFYKDIFDYVSFQKFVYDTRVNLDYGSSRGFEIIVTKSLTNNYQGSLGYTFQLAKGRTSDKFATQASPQLAGLPREVRLDFDQQHTLTLFLGYTVGPREDFKVFGLNVNNWRASITWNFGSGFPYTPFNQERTLEDLYLKNTGDGPYTSEVNISLSKGFVAFDKLNLAVTLDVTNLWNRRNVDLNGGGFNRFTGRPFVFGDFNPDERTIYPWAGRVSSVSFPARVPPFTFRAPRQISLGLRINWD